MRRVLFALSILAAVVLTLPTATGCSSPAKSPGTPKSPTSQGTVKVRAGTGTERFGVPMVAVNLTQCGANSVVAKLTTGNDGAATQTVPAGCYRATVTSVPSGCQADAVSNAQVEVRPDETAATEFVIHCA
ncbi:hypothetical protein [Nocardia alni]|uniref:hypothetical protein n=1 Tax=Nocardia alni TaxID=2815723 RepID=UPI001C21FFEE|nr:hypothetical protein [Nocardia alni]